LKIKIAMGILLTLLLVSIAMLAFDTRSATALQTIYIQADGSIDPPTANIISFDNVTYTFTDNINDSIVVDRSNITIDGAGYTLNGTGTGKWAGFTVEGYGSINVTIQNVNIVGFGVGIGLVSTDYNAIFECNITNCTYGIQGLETMNNTISGNIISNNTYGIFFNTGFYNEISGNNITHNDYGVWLAFSTYNKFYHNYFIDNVNQTYVEEGNPNIWDDGYPSGGNYWNDFEERYPSVEDIYSGEYPQSEPGSDGFWDGPYEINESNIDHYPIVPEFPSTIILPILTTLTMFITAFAKKKFLRKHET